MDFLFDKLILLCLCFVFLAEGAGSTTSVIIFLLSVTLAALGIYIEDRRLTICFFASIFLFTLLQPDLLLFYPVFLYDAVSKKMYPAVLPELALFFFQPVITAPRDWLLWITAAALAVLLAFKTLTGNRLMNELILTRDNGVELNLMLKEKNKTLLEKQDSEIYLATLRERNRIAREIHDNVGHMISRSLLLTGALLTVEKEGLVHDQLNNIKDTLDSAMTSIRQSVHDLHDDSVDLRQSVAEIIKTIEPDYNVALDYDMTENVPRRIKYCFIAIIKEAVSNVIRHSDADRIRIRLIEHPGLYQLTFEDNGNVLPVNAEHGIGLQNMRERVEGLQGAFRIHTEHGFQIFISVPKPDTLKANQP